ncbi:MAG: hypothetical protein KF764_29100 [Labilithrix sp.]|nr:hypothetical protein [Labilithrix sp.]MBX3223627.1 hypothetical protein [Labilithrix sp.]
MSEPACPFCGSAAEETRATATVELARPLSRAAVLFAGATTLAACVGGPGDPSSSSGNSGTNGSSSSSSSSSGSSGNASSSGEPEPDPDPQPVPAYGPAPVRDAG